MNYKRIRDVMALTEIMAAKKNGTKISNKLLEKEVPEVDEEVVKIANKFRDKESSGELYDINSKLKDIKTEQGLDTINIEKLEESKLPVHVKKMLLEREKTNPVIFANPVGTTYGEQYFAKRGLKKTDINLDDLDIEEEISEHKKDTLLTEEKTYELISMAQESLLEELLPDEGSAVIRIGDTIFQCKITGAKKIKK